MTSEAMLYIGCGCVVGDGAGRYLLVRETKPIARGRLSLPAGGLERDESLEESAVREVSEETGLVVASTGLLGVFHCARTSEDSYGVTVVFGARIAGGELQESKAHPELLWRTFDEIVAHHSSGMLRGAHVVEAVRRFAAGDYLPAEAVTLVGRND